MLRIAGYTLMFVCLRLFASDPPSITLYYSSHCPYSHKVLNHLDKMGKTVPMKDVSKDPEARKELIALGGKKQVPCLIVDKTAIYDSDAIIAWLDEHSNILLPKKERSDILK